MAQEHYLGRTVVDDARREWEVYRYLRPLQSLLGTPGYPSAPTNGTGPVASHDSALTAFAQLGALRLNCRRGVISLFDRSHQHVIAEGTRTLSLQDCQRHGPEDDLWLGAISTPRGDNPCGYAAGLLIPPEIESRDSNDGKGDQDYVVFPNMQKNPRFRNQSFVTGPKPHGRFYAGVPIISPDGFNIGVYCVLDDKPRDGASPSDIAFLKDMAATVMAHLVMVRAKDELHRSQKMVQGLSKFQYRQSSSEQERASDLPPKTKNQKSHSRRTSTDTDSHNQPTTTCNVRTTCQRAAHIIRDVADLDGVVILDASISKSSATNVTHERTTSVSSTSSDHSPPLEAHLPLNMDSKHDGFCTVFGSSLAKRPTNSSLPEVQPPLPMRQDFLQRLLRKYPSGKIWTHDAMVDKEPESAGIISCDGHVSEQGWEEWLERKILRQLFPGFRSLALVGLRQSASSRWFGASIIWSCGPTRVLSADGELSYLDTFGTSILSELARLDVKVASQAKTAFLSSISHELRTPLHGIMGSLECLQNTQVDQIQSDLLNTIDTCNQTLLDIFDNLLSFSSIDRLVNKQDNPEKLSTMAKGQVKASTTLNSNVGLRGLAEGVVETILAGRKFAHNTNKGDGDTNSSVNLLLEFDDTDNSHWTFCTQPGAWRRLILNLVSNGLKYTSNGSVSVRLSSKALPGEENRDKSQVTLTVTDTGKGMSPEFLRLQLFSPFVQEDPLAAGTGLGLSICKDIVTSLGGVIDVTSEQNKGSKFEITMALTRSFNQPEKSSSPSESTLLAEKCKKSHMKIGRAGTLDVPNSTSSKDTLESLFSRQCIGWLGLTTSISSQKNDQDFVIASEDELLALTAPLQSPLIVVRNLYSSTDVKSMTNIAPRVSYLTQPWTPSKLAKAISTCLDSASKLPMPAPKLAALQPPTPPQDAPSPPQASRPAATQETPTAPAVSVLLVDDNPINLSLLATYLKKQHHYYATATNGLEAVTLYKLHAYTHILMDINMPIMDGFKASRQIREFEKGKGGKGAKIIMLTGAGGEEVKEEAFVCGADLFLTKPVRLREVGRVLAD